LAENVFMLSSLDRAGATGQRGGILLTAGTPRKPRDEMGQPSYNARNAQPAASHAIGLGALADLG
jgi:hypothetical protein